MADKDNKFMRELIEHHVSGQLKVAPEHIAEEVLQYMQKPAGNTYDLKTMNSRVFMVSASRQL